ncbi:MAG: mannose-1-phosphate guanylyltransferase, partial [Kiritimatiellae bacterium]|nr:mannose-1-phosphate guanylyltransferase [Kiritimatiellia bacterium]
MPDNSYAVILAGGKGERFWPLSTSQCPKQFMRIGGRQSLMALAVERVRPVFPPDRIIVVTGKSLVGMVQQELPDLPRGNIIGEPVGRDTAAACALATILVRKHDPDAVMCILTADHVIGSLARFRKVLRACVRVAGSESVLVTIGIKPTAPSTGYGYIESGPVWKRLRGVEFRKVLRFVEKPDLKTARRFLSARNFAWNSGMFVWSVRTIWDALGQYCPSLANRMAGIESYVGSSRFESRLARVYKELDRISVDYAVLEKADNIVMAVGDFEWDDVGSWPSFAKYLPHDRWNNAVAGWCETI